MDKNWIKLGSVAPLKLEDARKETHAACQLTSAAGKVFLPPATDYSHHALSWVADKGVAVTNLIDTERPFIVGVSFEPFTLFTANDKGEEQKEINLAGKKVTEAFDWIRDQARDAGLNPDLMKLEVDRLPDTLAEENARFDGEDLAKARGEIKNVFANADLLLRTAIANVKGASPVLLWPHHFDIASLVVLKGEGESMTSVGLGLSPGDSGYAEPYYYATPWPYPDEKDLKEPPPFGEWHTLGWIGAVLTSTAIIAEGDGEAQATAATQFIKGAYESLKKAIL